ncbi:MAG: cyanophycin synthetase, partial [Ferruginibacter sp.]
LKHVKALTGLAGRWDVIAEQPTIILDVAHNEDGLKQLLEQLALVKPATSRLHMIIGMVKDKDVNKALIILPKDATYYFSNAHTDRAMPHEVLKEKAAGLNLSGNSYDDVNTAISAAISAAAASDTIIVCGSVFLIAEVDTALFSSLPGI